MSAVVAHYGDPRPTVRLVDQLCHQRTARPLEVIVVDDHSPAPLPDLPAEVHVVRRRTNGGYGAAVNDGAARAAQPLLLVLNNDVILQPSTVEDLVLAAAGCQPCVAGPATTEAGRSLVTGRRFPATWRHLAEELQPLQRWVDRPWYQRAIGRDLRCRPGATVTDVDWLQGSALLLPRAGFAAVGGFDPRFFMYSEEVDLQRRLHDAGVPSVFVGTVSIDHVGGGATDSSRRTEWLVRSQLTYAGKWGFGRRLRAALVATAVGNLAWNSARRLAGRDADPGAAWRQQLARARLPTWPEPRRDGSTSPKPAQP